MAKLTDVYVAVMMASWNSTKDKMKCLYTHYVCGERGSTLSVFPYQIIGNEVSIAWSDDPQERLENAKAALPEYYLWADIACDVIRNGAVEEITLPKGYGDDDIIPVYIKKATTGSDGETIMHYTVNGVSRTDNFETIHDTIEHVICRHSSNLASYKFTFPISLMGITIH